MKKIVAAVVAALLVAIAVPAYCQNDRSYCRDNRAYCYNDRGQRGYRGGCGAGYYCGR